MPEIATPALNEHEAAAIIGISPKTLRNWRVLGEGPPFFRAGRRLVRYRREDVAAWCEARLCDSTSKQLAETEEASGR